MKPAEPAGGGGVCCVLLLLASLFVSTVASQQGGQSVLSGTRDFIILAGGEPNPLYELRTRSFQIQLLRFCAPDEFPSLHATPLGVGIEPLPLNHSFMSYTPKPCRLHFLVSPAQQPGLHAMITSFVQHSKSGANSSCSPQKLEAQGPHSLTSYMCLPLLEWHLYDLDAVITSPAATLFHEGFSLDPAPLIRTWSCRMVCHTWLPASVTTAAAIDSDTWISGDLDELFQHLDSFKPGQLFGAAIEFAPSMVVADRLQRFSKAAPACGFGSAQNPAYNGLNGGVVLYHVQHMRQSGVWQQLLQQKERLQRVEGAVWGWQIMTHNLGDQDVLTTLALVMPQLVYILPCAWNYQLCPFWWQWLGRGPMKEALGEVGEAGFQRCQEKPKLWHGNGGTPILPEYLTATNGVTVYVTSHDSHRFEAVRSEMQAPLGSEDVEYRQHLIQNCSEPSGFGFLLSDILIDILGQNSSSKRRVHITHARVHHDRFNQAKHHARHALSRRLRLSA